jgi:DNA primase catalytic subunit
MAKYIGKRRFVKATFEKKKKKKKKKKKEFNRKHDIITSSIVITSDKNTRFHIPDLSKINGATHVANNSDPPTV